MNPFLAPRFRLGWALIAIAAINSLGWVLYRWKYENSYRNVQITVDYDDTRILADAYKIPHTRLLHELKQRGVTSLALYQQSLSNLRENGRVTFLTREEAERLYPAAPWTMAPAYRFVIVSAARNRDLMLQVLRSLELQSQPSLRPRQLTLDTGAATGPGFGIAIPASRQLLNDAQIGFDPAQIQSTKKAGMAITARISNPLNLDLERLRALLDEARFIGARLVISSEDEVLGYDTMIPDAAREMSRRGMLFGAIEFTKQRGWPDFAKRTEGALVRVHSVGGDEAAKVKMELLVDRFVRAVKERNIRVAYIRLIRQFKGEYSPPLADDPGAKPRRVKTALEQNLDFIHQVSSQLAAQPLPMEGLRPGLSMAAATGFGDYPISTLTKDWGSRGSARLVRYLGALLAGMGAVGAGLLLLNLFFDLSSRAQGAWFLAGVLLVAALSWSPGAGSKIMALEAGCFFPIIGMLWGGLPRLWPSDERDPIPGLRRVEVSPGQAFRRGALILLQTTAIVMIGSLLIITFLNHWKFMSKADEFLGEKATQLLPLLVIAVAFGGEMFPHRVAVEGAWQARRRLGLRVDEVLSHPFTARVAVVSVGVAVLGFLWIARTGNESGMEISSLELKMRALLEQAFITRPRTKEIFLGIPAAILAAYFALRGQKNLAVAAAVVMTLGQADILNTFCHIHTPIFYSLLRSLHGLWLGAVIGGVAIAIYSRVSRPQVFSPTRLSGSGGAFRVAGDSVIDGQSITPGNGVPEKNNDRVRERAE